jgi:hypothetical protein
MNRKFATQKGSLARNSLVIGLWVVMMGALIGELFFFAWCRVQFTRTGYELTTATTENRELHTDQRDLQIELERLKSPKRIEAKALALGLMMPTPEQTLRFQ